MANTYYYMDKLKFDEEHVVSIVNISKIRLLSSHFLIANNLVYLYITPEDKAPYNNYSDYMIDTSGKLLVPSPDAGIIGQYGTALNYFSKEIYLKESKEEVLFTTELYENVSRINKLSKEQVDEDFDIVYRVKGNNQYQSVKSSKVNLTKLDDVLSILIQLQTYDISSDDDDNFNLELEFLRVVTTEYGPTWNKFNK